MEFKQILCSFSTRPVWSVWARKEGNNSNVQCKLHSKLLEKCLKIMSRNNKHKLDYLIRNFNIETKPHEWLHVSCILVFQSWQTKFFPYSWLSMIHWLNFSNSYRVLLSAFQKMCDQQFPFTQKPTLWLKEEFRDDLFTANTLHSTARSHRKWSRRSKNSSRLGFRFKATRFTFNTAAFQFAWTHHLPPDPKLSLQHVRDRPTIWQFCVGR